MKYKILSHQSIDLLTNLVAESINEGWEPLGGVAVISQFLQGVGVPESLLMQAMIKKELPTAPSNYVIG